MDYLLHKCVDMNKCSKMELLPESVCVEHKSHHNEVIERDGSDEEKLGLFAQSGEALWPPNESV